MPKYLPSFAEKSPITKDELAVREEFCSFYVKAKHHFDFAVEEAEEKILQARKKAAQFLLKKRKEQRLRSAMLTCRHERGLLLATQLCRAQEKQAVLAEAERECVKLAIRLAEEVLQKEVSHSSEHLVEKVRGELQSLLITQRVRIFSSAADALPLSEALARYFHPQCFLVEVRDSVQQGNVVLVTPSGSIELNWREDLLALEHVLLERLEAKGIHA